MRQLVAILVMVVCSGSAHGYELLGLSLWQKEAEVLSALKNLNYKIEAPTEQGFRIKGPSNLSGWVDFCNGRLYQLAIPRPYSEFPSILGEAFRLYGESSVYLNADGDGGKYVVHSWEEDRAMYGISIYPEDRKVSSVLISLGTRRDCAWEAPNNSLRLPPSTPE